MGGLDRTLSAILDGYRMISSSDLLLNHCTTARTYLGSLTRKKSQSNTGTVSLFLALCLGSYRLLRTFYLDAKILRKVGKTPNPRAWNDKAIFTPSNSLFVKNGKLECRFFHSSEIEDKMVLSTCLSLGSKNTRNISIYSSKEIYILERNLTLRDLNLIFFESVSNLFRYFYGSILSNSDTRELLSEAMRQIHTEFSSKLILKSSKSKNFPKFTEVTYTHFEFEFGRAISLSFRHANTIGRAHGLIHAGKLQYSIIPKLMEIEPDFFPKKFEVEDQFGVTVFKDAKVRHLPRPKIPLDYQSTRLHIIGSIHTTLEELCAVVRISSEFNRFVIHYHPRMQNKNQIVRGLKKLFSNIEHNSTQIGKYISGFESRLILECIQSGAQYIPHRIDPNASEYLENSILQISSNCSKVIPEEEADDRK